MCEALVLNVRKLCARARAVGVSAAVVCALRWSGHVCWGRGYVGALVEPVGVE